MQDRLQMEVSAMTGTDPSLHACIYLAPHWATWSHLPLDGLGVHVIHGCCFLRVMLTHTSKVEQGSSGRQWILVCTGRLERPSTIAEFARLVYSTLNTVRSGSQPVNPSWACTRIVGRHALEGVASAILLHRGSVIR